MHEHLVDFWIKIGRANASTCSMTEAIAISRNVPPLRTTSGMNQIKPNGRFSSARAKVRRSNRSSPFQFLQNVAWSSGSTARRSASGSRTLTLSS
jgi:hypothetical protein